MSNKHEISSSSENNHHFIEIPNQTDESEITFTIRYATKPKTTQEEEKQEDEEEEITPDATAEEASKSIPAKDSSTQEKSVILLSIVVSTAMMMGAKMDIPTNYLLWTEKFIKNCKELNGKYPRNIQKILNILKVEDTPEEIDIPLCKCPPFFHKENLNISK